MPIVTSLAVKINLESSFATTQVHVAGPAPAGSTKQLVEKAANARRIALTVFRTATATVAASSVPVGIMDASAYRESAEVVNVQNAVLPSTQSNLWTRSL